MKPPCYSRRELLHRMGGGIGSLAFADLLNRQNLLAAVKSPLAAKPQQIPAKAKAVISIFCYGGVSQVDTFDPKPELLKRQGETMTEDRSEEHTSELQSHSFISYAVF